MPIFSSADPNFYEDITTQGMEWLQASGREAGIDVGAIVMGPDPRDPAAPVVMIARASPGAAMPRHAHDAYRVEIQLHGSMQVGDRVLLPGDVSTSAPGEFYGPNVAGPDGSVSVEFISSIAGIAALVATDEATPEQAALIAQVHERLERNRVAAEHTRPH